MQKYAGCGNRTIGGGSNRTFLDVDDGDGWQSHSEIDD
jgi:hypothetical protein